MGQWPGFSEYHVMRVGHRLTPGCPTRRPGQACISPCIFLGILRCSHVHDHSVLVINVSSELLPDSRAAHYCLMELGRHKYSYSKRYICSLC